MCFDSFTHIDYLDVGKSLFLVQCLIVLLILLNSLLKVFLSLLITQTGVVGPMNLHLFDVIRNYCLIIAHRFDPDQPILSLHLFGQLFCDFLPPLFAWVGAIENGNNIVGFIDVLHHIRNDFLGDKLPQLTKFLIVFGEKLGGQLDVIIWVIRKVPHIYFLRKLPMLKTSVLNPSQLR